MLVCSVEKGKPSGSQTDREQISDGSFSATG